MSGPKQEVQAMSEITDVAQPSDDSGVAPHHASRLNQALAWVGIIAGGVFVVGAIFLSGFFLNWSEHAHMQMGHAAMSQEKKDCCADMKPGDMKPGEMKPGAMGPEMMGPQSGH
jgi:hypothetical protein